METTTAYRKRFERGEAEHPLTPKKLRLLLFVAECRILTPPQLSGLSGMSAQAVRGHMRDLYHLGLVERSGVPRAAFAGIDDPNEEDLLWGSAPTIYTLSKEGAQNLLKARLIEKIPDIPDYGPKNALFLAHEVEVRDVRVWLEKCRKTCGGQVDRWTDGADARMEPARPDAWFVYQMPTASLVGLVEVDRGTETGPSRWQDKARGYGALFQTDAVRQTTGKRRARVTVVAPSAKRRDWIAATIKGEWADRFAVADKAGLEGADLTSPVWRVPGSQELLPLVSPGLL